MLAGATPVLVHNCDIDGEYLYRGVGDGHRQHAAALEGRAVPRLGDGFHSDPIRHVGNDTGSVFTSWTHDIERAMEEDEEWGPGSVVMRIRRSDLQVPVGPSRDIQIHGTEYDGGWAEAEHLIVSDIDASEISIGGGPWFNPRAR